jgi:transposase InsO family protein
MDGHQLTAACGWEQLPRYLIRDRDACYGDIFVRRIRSLGIRDHATSARSPWQNGYAERLIGSIRRECHDHVVVVGEQHLRHILMCYMEYYNAVRTHLSLGKDAPVRRLIQRTGHPSEARSWRAAPSIRTDLIFGRDRCGGRDSSGLIAYRDHRLPAYEFS